MLDFAWSEIALIAGVALVLIGPKDLPIALKAVSGMVKKARRMAAEFQTHVDDMMRDADLQDVREQFRDIRRLDIRGTIARAVDNDGSIRKAFQDPIREPPPVVTTPVEALPEHTIASPEPVVEAALPERYQPAVAFPQTTRGGYAPAFIPPELVPTPEFTAVPPAFIPPGAAQYGARAAQRPGA